MSLIIVPRYPQTDRAAEDRLRKRREPVKGGVVLGESAILSDDSRTLLRQVLVSRDRQVLFSRLHSILGPFEAVALAILALLGLRAAAPVADAAGRRVVESSQQAFDAPRGERWITMVKNIRRSPNDREVDEREAWLAQREAWFADVKGETVTVWLRSGGNVRGTVATASPRGAVRLTDARFARQGSEPDHSVETMLVPLEDALLIARTPIEPPAAGIRRASLRLVAEIVAELTGESLTAIEKQPLVDAVERAAKGFRGAEAPPKFDLDDLIAEASTAQDVELHAALRVLKDGFQLIGRRPDDSVARDSFFKALIRVVQVGAQPVSWTALASDRG